MKEMEYKEEEFKVKANSKARTVWMILNIILTIAYGSDVGKGIRTGEYYLIFLLMCWYLRLRAGLPKHTEL